MAYLIPTTGDFLYRFPEFKPVEEIRIQQAIVEATLFVDEITWKEEHYDLAIMFLAAHNLVAEGILINTAKSGGSSIGNVPTDGDVSQINVGDVNIKFGSGTKTSQQTGVGQQYMLSATIYGIRYLQLKNKNMAGTRILIRG